jgi:hypothetical protein
MGLVIQTSQLKQKINQHWKVMELERFSQSMVTRIQEAPAIPTVPLGGRSTQAR